MKRLLQLSACILFFGMLQAQQKRPVAPIDVYRLQNISNPQISPDGKWVLYALSSVDTAKDKQNKDLCMTSWDGK